MEDALFFWKTLLFFFFGDTLSFLFLEDVFFFLEDAFFFEDALSFFWEDFFFGGEGRLLFFWEGRGEKTPFFLGGARQEHLNSMDRIHRIQLLDTARHCPLERRGRAVCYRTCGSGRIAISPAVG